MDAHPQRHNPARTLAILVVEDNRELREQICAQLREHGCHVVNTASGAEGLEAVVLEHFDAVVTDVQMLPRGALWLWREITQLRPELRGRFVFCSPEPGEPPREGPWQAERVLRRPLAAEQLWAQILAVTASECSGRVGAS